MDLTPEAVQVVEAVADLLVLGLIVLVMVVLVVMVQRHLLQELQ
jgi:hypothetical protein